MKGRSIWEALARKGTKVVRTEEIADLASRLEKDPAHVVRHLRRSRLLVPLFKGYYYVRTPDEVLLNAPGPSPLELFALAAKAKGIGRWYFGLHTALRLDGLSHEFRNVEYVIGDRLYRIRGIRMAGTSFVCLRWTPALLDFGLIRAKDYAYSDPAKTVLDFAYWDYWAARKHRKPSREWRSHIRRVDTQRLHSYAKPYPPHMAAEVEAAV